MGLRQITPFYRFLFLLVLSVAMMIIDHRTDSFRLLRTVGSVVTVPFYTLVSAPDTLMGKVKSYYPDDSLYREHEQLREELLVVQTRLQRFDALVAENDRLTKLLSASRRSREDVLLTNIIDVGLEPFSHRVVIDRGIESGVYPGQPAIGPEGVIGQVSTVNYKHSVVTLITDRSHGIPVQVQRNGLRTIVQGMGVSDQVGVPFLPSQADIRTGDILVTSGMGGRFPVGYKVAEVKEIIKDANEAFLSIQAVTTARI
ncbi:MAG: rod shape-determining protein MreC, partial [Pseudomonadota bacterium]